MRHASTRARAICAKPASIATSTPTSRVRSASAISPDWSGSEYDTIEAFKAAFSRTPKQYLIERRLAHARAMLRDGSATILAIAMACGFGTQSHLTATMRMHFGETPGQIRKRGTGA
ncbi:helix-turn-helix transcriptional regulator [Burkholderia gladioli]|uniref:helix-turn-helix transcriptional regulator n=1 Tax=Burkholderia gladioli TaxID=28095 RepID=UPI001F52125D|nr:AraC family transcriptional regulator [Burkholderia gladioli]